MNMDQARNPGKFKQLINEAHERSGSTLRQLEEGTGLSFGYICQITHGRIPPRDTLIVLCCFGWYLTLEETNRILESVSYQTLVSN